MAATVAESSLSTEISESLLQCPICHCAFAKPKVLACQHSYCAKCLKGWLQTRSKKTNKVKCAVCRKITVLPQHGVEGLPENYAIKGLLSMMKDREKKVVGKAAAAKNVGTAKNVCKKLPNLKVAPKPQPKSTEKNKTAKPKSGKEIAKQVAEIMKAKGPASKTKTGTAPAKTSKLKSPVASAASKQDKNANVMRRGKKKIPAEEESSEEGSDSDGSSEYDSDEGSSDYGDEDELTPDDSYSDSEESSGDDSDVPPTPTMKMYGEIKVGMEVFVFNRRGKKFPAVVKLLESCQLKPPTQPRTYAGVELEKENASLVTDDMDDIDESYLSFWLEENVNPCAVVRADDCIPASLVNQLMGS